MRVFKTRLLEIVLCIFLSAQFSLLPSFLVAQSIYYISSTEGNDLNTGLSSSQPWKSMDKVNSLAPSPGDQMLFKRGDSWNGTLTINSSGTSGSPITYGAYGTGEKPVIYGSEIITGWSVFSGNIYKANVANDVYELFLNGSKMKAARFPNKGYANIDAVPTANSLTCNALNGGINYSGAGFASRTNGYAFETNSVASSSGTTLTLKSTPAFSLSVKEGFILVNKLEFLDSAGEWFYDTANDLLYLWTPSNDSPNNYTVRCSVRDYGVMNNSKNYIVVNNLDIRQCASSGIYNSGSNCVFDNNVIQHCNIQAINSMFGINNAITKNTIKGCNQYGLYIYTSGVSNTIISDNEISDIMVFEELGLSLTGKWFSGSALYVEGPGNIVQYNKIVNSGYNGIQFAGKNTIQYNYIKDACKVKDDGGGIYTSTSANYPNATNAGSLIKYNIIDGVTGTLEGFSGFTYTYGEGIYLDEITGYVSVKNNTVANCTSNGIFLHNSYHDTIMNNTVFNCKNQLCSSISKGRSVYKYNTTYALKQDMQNSTIELNVYESNANDTWDHNWYVNHYNTNAFKKENTLYDFEGWKTATGQDANSIFDESPHLPGQSEKLLYNETKQTKSFDLGNGIYRDLSGYQVFVGSISLEPFTSKILIRMDSPNGLSPIKSKGRNISAYPNPTTGTVSLIVSDLPSDLCKLSLYDLSGKLHITYNLAGYGGSLIEELDLSFLNSGAYVIYLECGSELYQSKLIVDK